MYPDMPIEQLVRRIGMAFQFAFATEAKELLPQREEFLLRASRKGLRVLAKNEEGLTIPVETLREVYGPSLQVEPPRVRLIEGVQLREPSRSCKCGSACMPTFVRSSNERFANAARLCPTSTCVPRTACCDGWPRLRICSASRLSCLGSPPAPRSTGLRSATTPS